MQPGESAGVAELLRVTKTALIAEIEQLAEAVRQFVGELTDEQLWTKPVDPGNSVGHLVLHLTGNLSHFVGAQIGGTSYVRDREREFTETTLPTRQVLLTSFDATIATVCRVVEGLDAARLCAPHPEARFGTVLGTLLRVTTHFALHRGQMSYIVRLVKQK
jgi:uncharacterized damage-inducible protein DinB